MLVVDDALVDLAIIRQMLRNEPDIEITATARDGKTAITRLEKGDIDLILTDLHMPGMDGLELTRHVMRTHPMPILVMSGDYNDALAFTVLDAGALDIIPKPRAPSPAQLAAAGKDIARRIRVLAGVRVLRRPKQRPPLAAPTRVPPRLIIIGASTGGPQAIQQVLAHLPATTPTPIICVQHIATQFLGGLLGWLQPHVALKLSIARAGDHPQRGHVYFPPEDHHLGFHDDGSFRITTGDAVDGHRPSATFTMKDAARIHRAHTLGVLLTGMGRDGATGLLAIHDAGGRTIAQNQETCVVYGMPAEAARLGAAQAILPLEDIGPAIAAACETPAPPNSK